MQAEFPLRDSVKGRFLYVPCIKWRPFQCRTVRYDKKIKIWSIIQKAKMYNFYPLSAMLFQISPVVSFPPFRDMLTPPTLAVDVRPKCGWSMYPAIHISVWSKLCSLTHEPVGALFSRSSLVLLFYPLHFHLSTQNLCESICIIYRTWMATRLLSSVSFMSSLFLIDIFLWHSLDWVTTMVWTRLFIGMGKYLCTRYCIGMLPSLFQGIALFWRLLMPATDTWDKKIWHWVRPRQ